MLCYFSPCNIWPEPISQLPAPSSQLPGPGPGPAAAVANEAGNLAEASALESSKHYAELWQPNSEPSEILKIKFDII